MVDDKKADGTDDRGDQAIHVEPGYTWHPIDVEQPSRPQPLLRCQFPVRHGEALSLFRQFIQYRRFGINRKLIAKSKRALDGIFQFAESLLRVCESVKPRSR